MSIELVTDYVLIVFALTVMATDWRWQRIPNVVTYPTMLIGLVLSAASAFPGEIGAGGLIDHAAATILALAALFPLYSMNAMKAGDVKLLMAVGALKGLVFLFWAFVYGAVIGGFVAIAYIVYQRLIRGRRLDEVLRTFIPYGVSLALGALVALAAGTIR